MSQEEEAEDRIGATKLIGSIYFRLYCQIYQPYPCTKGQTNKNLLAFSSFSFFFLIASRPNAAELLQRTL